MEAIEPRRRGALAPVKGVGFAIEEAVEAAVESGASGNIGHEIIIIILAFLFPVFFLVYVSLRVFVVAAEIQVRFPNSVCTSRRNAMWRYRHPCHIH